MTKVINKMVLLVLMVLVFSICWLVTPVHAAEVATEDTTSAEFSLGDVASPTALYYLKGITMIVCPARYDNTTGEYYYVTGANNEYVGVNSSTGYLPYNVTLPHAGYSLDGWNFMYVQLVYEVTGGSSYRVDFQVDNPELVSYEKSVSSGRHLIEWIVPKKYSTYSLNVTPSGTMNALYLGGHIDMG